MEERGGGVEGVRGSRGWQYVTTIGLLCYCGLCNTQECHCLKTYDPKAGPYRIGLTGGIASGKSSIFKRLTSMGAYPIDCDKVSMEVLPKGDLYQLVSISFILYAH